MAQRIVRIAFALVAWLFLIAIVIQVFLAGVGLFVVGIDTFSYHRELGWQLPIGPLLGLPLAWAARAGLTTIGLSVVLVVLVVAQPLLPGLRSDLPFVAAVHPVNAMAIFWLATLLARRALALARQPVSRAASASDVFEGAANRP